MNRAGNVALQTFKNRTHRQTVFSLHESLVFLFDFLAHAATPACGAGHHHPTRPSSTGNTDYNTANGSRNLILPAFGLELEQAFARHFRWEAKASGFGIPGRDAIGDMEGTLVARVRQVELMAGEKFYYLKTSPKSAAYFTDQLSGAYVGVRYYWGRE